MDDGHLPEMFLLSSEVFRENDSNFRRYTIYHQFSFGHRETDIAGTGVSHDPDITIGFFLYFDEVVLAYQASVDCQQESDEVLYDKEQGTKWPSLMRRECANSSWIAL